MSGRVPDMWRAVAQQTQAWLLRQGVAPRDAVLLLPYAALLAPARAAFAEQGGWLPRVETTLTLAEALAPPPPREPGACSGDSVSDRLHGAALLRGMGGLTAGEQTDPKGFALMAQRLADTAAASAPALRIVADTPGDDPFTGLAPPERLRRLVCADSEAEAQAAAAEVIDAVNDGRTPVALVALDRLLVRRVRALLERRGLDLVDETGWRLSTTVAGARGEPAARSASARRSR